MLPKQKNNPKCNFVVINQNYNVGKLHMIRDKISQIQTKITTMIKYSPSGF